MQVMIARHVRIANAAAADAEIVWNVGGCARQLGTARGLNRLAANRFRAVRLALRHVVFLCDMTCRVRVISYVPAARIHTGAGAREE